MASALGLLNLEKPFTLYIAEKQTGSSFKTIRGYSKAKCLFSKQLDQVTFVKESSKFTLGEHVKVLTPNQVQSLLETKGHRWLTGG